MKDVDECKISVYFCHSNNFVGIFSGLDTSYITDADMLQKAKTNYLRMSCIVITECWNETVTCLENIGFHLRNNEAFDIAGG